MKPILEEKANIDVFQEKFKLLMSQLDENSDGMVDRVGTFQNNLPGTKAMDFRWKLYSHYLIILFRILS